jgi:hypothetical protein
MTAGLSPGEIAALFSEIGEELSHAEDGDVVLDLLAQLATRRVAGAEYAGVTVGRGGQRFETVAMTHDLVLKIDKIQYELRSGPCVDAIVAETTFNAADLRTDHRWPEFGRRCVERTGIVSMLSLRLYIESDREVIAGLNMYSHQPAAFDENSEAIAQLLATHGSVAVGKAAAQAKSRNLLQALKTSRQIGIAMGIIMANEKVTEEEAFDLLRIASQRTHRKLAEIATDVAYTGLLPPEAAQQRT